MQTHSVMKNSIKPVAVITGASAGIGYEFAQVFADNGFDLIIAAEDDRIYDAANTFQALGVQVEAVKCDLAMPEGVQKLEEKIVRYQDRIDSLVLNAGIGVGGAPFFETRLEEELKLVDLNIVSVIKLTKSTLPLMLQQNHGRIMFVSSIAADLPGPYLAVYAASKAFVQSFADALRYELKNKNITITSLQPGPTDTEFFERAHMMNTKAGQSKKDDPALVAKQGFEALMEGKDNVVGGSFKNKATIAVSKLVSEDMATSLHARQSKPQDRS